jgi:hypothetical protein
MPIFFCWCLVVDDHSSYINRSIQGRNLLPCDQLTAGEERKRHGKVEVRGRINRGRKRVSNPSRKEGGSNLLDLLGGDAGRRGRRSGRPRGHGHGLLHRRRTSLGPSSSSSRLLDSVGCSFLSGFYSFSRSLSPGEGREGFGFQNSPTTQGKQREGKIWWRFTNLPLP